MHACEIRLSHVIHYRHVSTTVAVIIRVNYLDIYILCYETEVILFITMVDFNTNCGETLTFWFMHDKNVIFLDVIFINHEILTPFNMPPHLTVLDIRCIRILYFFRLSLLSCAFVGCDTVLPCNEISEVLKKALFHIYLIRINSEYTDIKLFRILSRVRLYGVLT
jgi:hypothetical protein